MKVVTILVPEGVVLAAIADPRYLFTAVNQFLVSQGKEELFDVKLVGLRKDVHLNDGLFSVHPDWLVGDAKYSDLIIVPALSGDLQASLEMNKDFLPWIVAQHQKGAEVASLCIGAFLLAATGLLEGKYCSTHWLFANQFRTMFPVSILVDDKIITEQNGIYTSGGASSYWNLLLYLVEKYVSREMAILAAKFFALDIGRNGQSAFVIFTGQKEHGDAQVRQAQEFIETHYQDKIHVEDIADKVGLGRRTFERRFKKATTNSVMEYIQRVKMEAVKKQLESSHKSVSELMYEVGYTDSKAFRDVFRKITGISPNDYRNKYNKRTFVVGADFAG
ncbi:MAG TPA: helix-turn-helix domain-containing protein [Bacteroidia bacterium]|nr:helix-turn-helix domain-containing protein [Bacteroidia bacterium]